MNNRRMPFPPSKEKRYYHFEISGCTPCGDDVPGYLFLSLKDVRAFMRRKNLPYLGHTFSIYRYTKNYCELIFSSSWNEYEDFKHILSD